MAMTAVNAEPVSRQQALKQARQFMPGKQFGEARSFARSDNSSDKDPFYVFNAAGNGGYVIVSGDDRTLPILGYSETGNLDMSQLPENLRCWLEGYVRQIEALGSSLQPVQRATTQAENSKSAIEPLIKTKWNQDEPYNLMCPDGNFVDYDEAGYDAANRCVTGCVATAMAQLMYFWQWPNGCEALDQIDIGTKVNKGTAEAPDWQFEVDHSFHALPDTTFNWEAMKLAYNGSETDASATAVATLLRYCGQAVNMDYNLASAGGSQAGISPSVLAETFGYSKNIRNIYRDLYTTSAWEDKIYAELAAGRPVLYSGQSGVGGHQFIVDGYDGNGLFHMNWGWGGLSDDYYVLSLADPDSQGAGGAAGNRAFQFDQDALIGVKPAPEGEVLTAQIESNIDAMETATYNRASQDDNFVSVLFDGIFFAHFNVPSTEELKVQTGWALCQNGQIKEVVHERNNTLEAGGTYSGLYTDAEVSFGAGLALGKYEVCQVYKYPSEDEWKLCIPHHETAFLIAEVTATTLTVRQAKPSFVVNSVTVPEYPSLDSSLDVTVNITNDGETFENILNLWAQKDGESTWTNIATQTSKIDPGKSGDVIISFMPTAAGTYNLKITSSDSEEALTTAAVTIYAPFEKTIDNITYSCHPGTHKAKVVGHTYPSSTETADIVIKGTLNVDDVEYTVTEIADEAFRQFTPSSNMPPVLSITLPSTIEKIGYRAFYNCYKLEEIVIPEGVKSIGDEAFSYCLWLTKIELPSTLTSIGNKAFLGLKNINYLESVVSHATNPISITKDVFGVEDGDNIIAPTATLTVPFGSKAKYEKAVGWKEFQETKQMPPTVDIATIVNCIMNGTYSAEADVNNDEKVDATDLVMLVNLLKE